ncbi:SpoIVB peptidase [Syntrophomonas erecta]
MKQLRPVAGIILAVLILAISFSPQARIFFNLPDQQKMVVGESSHINFGLPDQWQKRIQMQVMGESESVFASPQDPPVAVNRSTSGGYEIVALKPGRVDVTFKLLGYIPIKSMAVESVPTRRVVLGGHSIGVLLQSDGIMVVGFAPVVNSQGEKVYPARDKGIEIGDLILKIDGKTVRSENDLARIIDEKRDVSTVITVKRRNEVLSLPVRGYYCSETQRYRVGLYVRDGVVGVGTLTFWSPENRQYAALGHIIIDADTRQGIDVLKGKIVGASVQTVKPGKPGRPGEKIGVFSSNSGVSGNIIKNTHCGIYGITADKLTNPLKPYTVEVGYAHQVKPGRAQIYTVINGDEIEAFDIEIEKIHPERQNGKGMVIRITDSRLLSVTGGIVQGMSGSPIVQNGKIVGAITHVFLNDPHRGYGIFMDNMLSEMAETGERGQTVSTNYK